MKRFNPLRSFSSRRRQNRQRPANRLRFESLENRDLLATLLAGLDSSGNFLVTDSAGSEDDLVFLYRSGTNIVAYSDSGIDADGVGQTSDDNWVSVPSSAITGQIIVDLAGGANALIVTWNASISGSSPTPTPNGDPTVAGGISYTVLNDADDDDFLAIEYPGSGVVTVDYSPTTSIQYAGSVRVAGSAGSVGFTNVENADASALVLRNVTNAVFNLPGRGDRGVLAVDSETDGISLQSAAVSGATFASTLINTSDATSIVINMGGDNGTFAVEAVRDLISPSDQITINGQAGSDTISIGSVATPISLPFSLMGGDGNDTISGGEGVDVIQGGLGDDVLSGLVGDDTLIGGDGQDVLKGGAGDDLLSGQGGDDMLFGDTGADAPTPDDGDDTLSGGLGSDILNGEAGEDVVRGEEGNDILRIRGDQAAADTLSGGAGSDTLEFVGEPDDYVVLEEFGGTSTRTLSLERIVAGGRFLTGTDDANVFDFSNVMIVSVAAIYGLDGDDTITGTKGSDIIYGHSAGATSAVSDNDTLSGGGGNDEIYGGLGEDKLNGGAGNDVLDGGSEDDDIDGGMGNDTIQTKLNESEFDIIQGGAGNDQLVNTLSTALSSLVLDSFDGLVNGIESLRGNGNKIIGNGNDNVFDFRRGGSGMVTLLAVTEIRGGDGADIIRGGSATDLIFGEDGNDELFGGGGNDTISGGAGDDIIRGEAGVDVIDGGAGADRLFGGDSNDIFVFNVSDADSGLVDTVEDYRNDFLKLVGYPITGYSTPYAAIRSESIDGGVRITQRVSNKQIDLKGSLKTRPASSRFIFVDGV